MRFKQVGNKKDVVAVVIQNDEATIALMTGAPCFFKPNGTTPGLSVTSSEGLAAASNGFFAGFVLAPQNTLPSGTTIPAASYGEAQCYGMFDYARVLLSTRAASTDVWASYPAIVIGDIMSFVTTSGVQGVTRSGAGSATNIGGWAVQAGSALASATTLASSVGGASSSLYGNSTALMTALRVFVRVM